MTNFSEIDIKKFLNITLDLAHEAFTFGDYPIGAVIVDQFGNIISKNKNECYTGSDISAHAEIQAIRKLGKLLETDNNYTLFTSLEPCFGCSFFIARTNINNIYSALKDPHKGGIYDLKQLEKTSNFFKKINLVIEPFKDLRTESAKLMREYFLKNNKLETANFYKI